MRETRTAQQSIFQSSTDHEISRELARISMWLDQHPELLTLVEADLIYRGGSKRGRRGITVETVLRCAILKQYRQVDYRSLAFYLKDSVSFREFARLQPRQHLSKSTLQKLISAIRPETWEAMQRCVTGDAYEQGIEQGDVIRIDATVTDTAILEPTDSGLLYDSVRVMVRLLKQARRIDPGIAFHNRQRVAKRRRVAIMHARTNVRRYPLYVDLLAATLEMLEALGRAYKTLIKPL